eukprot:scaffold10123_cov117-Isochrysis_galbana.AAC.6
MQGGGSAARTLVGRTAKVVDHNCNIIHRRPRVHALGPKSKAGQCGAEAWGRLAWAHRTPLRALTPLTPLTHIAPPPRPAPPLHAWQLLAGVGRGWTVCTTSVVSIDRVGGGPKEGASVNPLPLTCVVEFGLLPPSLSFSPLSLSRREGERREGERSWQAAVRAESYVTPPPNPPLPATPLAFRPLKILGAIIYHLSCRAAGRACRGPPSSGGPC